jgi:adenylate cyclase
VQEIALDLEALRSLSKITASINSQTDLSALLQMIAKEAVTTLKAHQSSVMLLDSRGRVLKTAATYGVHSEVVENATVRLGEGVAGWVAEHGEPRLMQGRLDPEAFRKFIPKDRGISSAMSVPLQIEDMTLGVLNVSLLESERQFNENELSLIMIYANHAAVAVRNAALLRETKEKAKMQSILEGYVSPQVAEKLMGAPEDTMNVGEVRELTVLFADIRGFTRIAHQMGPKKTRLFLNEVFTRLAEIIFDHQGTLDKFMGDSVMAFFGAPLKVEAPALKAVEAARSMILTFQEILGQWGTKSGHVKSLSLGIGISTGRLFIGNVGSRQRFDYTVIGQEVNLAKRLCDRAQKGQILLSKSTRSALPSEVRLHDLGETSFKGVDLPVQLYEVVFEKP